MNLSADDPEGTAAMKVPATEERRRNENPRALGFLAGAELD